MRDHKAFHFSGSRPRGVVRKVGESNVGKRLSGEQADDIETTINRIRKKCGWEGLTKEEQVTIVKFVNVTGIIAQMVTSTLLATAGGGGGGQCYK